MAPPGNPQGSWGGPALGLLASELFLSPGGGCKEHPGWNSPRAVASLGTVKARWEKEHVLERFWVDNRRHGQWWE